MVLVPGGGWSSRGERGAWAEAERGLVPAQIAAAHERGARIASVCTGAMLLAAAGITDGRPATTHHSALADLRASGAEVVDARVVDDGDVLTAAGVTSGIDLALYLVERASSAEIADQVAGEIEYERRFEVAGR
jgi:transcriptional regulator GlxA family with amidase domain